MKYQLTLKDPDGVYESIERAAKQSVNQVQGLSEDEKDSLIETRREELDSHSEKWIEYSEYVTLEIDTEANTCVVIPRK